MAETPTSTTVGFALKAGDLRRGALLYSHPWRYGVAAGLAFALFSAATFLWSSRGDPAPVFLVLQYAGSAGSLFGLGMFIMSRFILVPLRTRRLWRHNRTFYEDVSVVFTNEGFSYRTPKSEAYFSWRETLDYKEDDRVRILRVSKSLYFIVPKKFKTESEGLDCAEILKRNVKRRGRSRRAGTHG